MSDEKDFAEAYNNAMGRDVMEVPEETEPPEVEDEETTEPEGEEAPIEGEAPEGEEVSPDGEDGEEEGVPEGEAEGEEEQPAPTKTVEELLEENNRLREQSLAWAGRVSAADKRLLEAEQARKPKIKNILADDGTLGEGFKELVEEYPELKNVEDVLQAQQQQITEYRDQFSAIDGRLSEVQYRQAVNDAVQAVEQVYPDYQNKINNEEFVQYVHANVPPEIVPTLTTTTDPELLKTVVGGFLATQAPARTETVQTDTTDRKKKNEAALHASLGVSTRSAAVVAASEKKEKSLDDLFDESYKRAQNY